MAADTYKPTGSAAAGGYDPDRSGWTGWIGFAGVVMIISGGLNAPVRTHRFPASPIWPLVVVTIDVLVIWALTAHGKETRQT